MQALPSATRMYRALSERDASFAGIFIVGVRTTGIFCQPGCKARTPLRQNCAFFRTPAEALRAGLRPCKKCRPLDRERGPGPGIAALLDKVETDPDTKITDRELLRLGIDPTTARRGFQRHCGMTFHAYQRARRMARALGDIRKGSSVTQTAARSGYGSFSGFGAAFQRMFGAPPSRAGDVRCLVADWITTPLGPMLAIADDEGLWLLEFHDRRALAREIAWLRRHTGAAIVPGKNAVLRQIASELAGYFEGKRTHFATTLHLEGSEFQLRTWRALLAIEPGTTRSYGAMAAEIGFPASFRAVGRANGDNRLALVVPCHRVIRADGTTCGYGGGLWRKRWLLDHEAATASPDGVSRRGAAPS